MVRPSRARGVVLGAIACILATTQARTGLAQGAVSVVAHDLSDPNNNAISGCGSNALLFQPTASYTCGPVSIAGGLYNSSSSASAIAGQLRAYTGGTVTVSGGGATSYAVSQWSDQATVNPVSSASSAAYLQIALQVTGAQSGSGGSASGSPAGWNNYASFVGQSTNSSDPVIGQSWVNGAGPQTSPLLASSVDQIFLLTLAVSHGSTAQFTYGLSTIAGVYNFGVPPLGATAYTDFSHTVNPLWYHVLDGNNADVTSDYNVRFANGLEFGPEPSTTPEPSSALLLLPGLVGIAGVAKRRTRNGR